MKRKIVLLILIMVTGVSDEILAQIRDGDWYTPIRNKLLHINISKDSILFRKCSFDIAMTDYGYVEMAFQVEKVINGSYIVSEVKDTIPVFHLLNFKSENGVNKLNIASLNNEFSTAAEAEKSIKLIGQQPVYIILLDKPGVEKIRQQKDLTTMTTKDFKNYALKIIGLDSSNAAFRGKRFKLSYVYAESMGRVILSELGFNSLVKGNVFDSMMEKFAENPETQEIFIRMAGGGK